MKAGNLLLKSGVALSLDGIGDVLDFGSHNGQSALSFSIFLPVGGGNIIELADGEQVSIDIAGIISYAQAQQIYVENISGAPLEFNAWQRVFILFTESQNLDIERLAGSLSCYFSDLCIYDVMIGSSLISEDYNNLTERASPTERFLINESSGSFLYGKNTLGLLNGGSGSGAWITEQPELYQYGINERSELPVFSGNVAESVSVNDVVLTDEFTLSAWVLFKGGDRARVIFGGDATNLLGIYNSGQIRNQINAGGPFNYNTGQDLIPGKIYHLVLTRDDVALGKTIKLYIDGVFIESKNINSDNVLTISSLFAGGFGSVMEGAADHLSVFEVEFSAAEVLELYNEVDASLHSQYGDSVAYWVFDGDRYIDKKSANNGVLGSETDTIKLASIAGKDVLQSQNPIFTRKQIAFLGDQGKFELNVAKPTRRIMCWICPHEVDNNVILTVNNDYDIEINSGAIEDTFIQNIDYMVNDTLSGVIQQGVWQLLTIFWDDPIDVESLLSYTSEIQFGAIELSFFGEDEDYVTDYWNETNGDYE